MIRLYLVESAEDGHDGIVVDGMAEKELQFPTPR